MVLRVRPAPLGNDPLFTVPYEQRRDMLEDLLADAAAPVGVPPFHVGVNGVDLLTVASEAGLEGVVAKRLHSQYLPG
ncbi:hypothetical protein [Actinophytocola sp.]|uniref:hypothetical protein n=1 Tax=Actinophytocola sp. TaxID=1872138 RepID=UPI002ED3FCF7